MRALTGAFEDFGPLRTRSLERALATESLQRGEREGLAPPMEQIPFVAWRSAALAAGRIRAANSRGDREAVASPMEQIPFVAWRSAALAAGRIRAANSRGDREAVASRMGKHSGDYG